MKGRRRRLTHALEKAYPPVVDCACEAPRYLSMYYVQVHAFPFMLLLQEIRMFCQTRSITNTMVSRCCLWCEGASIRQHCHQRCRRIMTIAKVPHCARYNFHDPARGCTKPKAYISLCLAVSDFLQGSFKSSCRAVHL